MPTNITWADETWNPVTGCKRVSKGCDNCYAVSMTRRLAGRGMAKYTGLVGNGHFNGVVKCHEDALWIPQTWKKPRLVFVNSMSDLFHERVPRKFTLKVFQVMSDCREHTFQVLTKRPQIMADYCISKPWNTLGGPWYISWPVLPNVWLGASVEDQATADERIPHLQRCPAAVRFLSVEPMLGPIRFPSLKGIHWVIFGCESGLKQRPCDNDWIRDGIAQCDKAGVPVFVKQIGRPGSTKVFTDPRLFPEDLRRQEWPKVTP